MLVASSSPIKFSKIVFRVWNFVQSLTEVAVQKQFLSVVANHSKSDFFFTVNWIAESEDIRQVYSPEFLLNTATIREVKLGDFFLLKIVRWEKHNCALLQRQATNNHTKSQNCKNENTQLNLHSDFPCHLKVDRDKLALINCQLKCKKEKGRRLPLVYTRKLAEHGNFTGAVSRCYRGDRGQR